MLQDANKKKGLTQKVREVNTFKLIIEDFILNRGEKRLKGGIFSGWGGSTKKKSPLTQSSHTNRGGGIIHVIIVGGGMAHPHSMNPEKKKIYCNKRRHLIVTTV